MLFQSADSYTWVRDELRTIDLPHWPSEKLLTKDTVLKHFFGLKTIHRDSTSKHHALNVVQDFLVPVALIFYDIFNISPRKWVVHIPFLQMEREEHIEVK